MKAKLRKLRLREGDLLLVRDHDTMESLIKLGPVKGVPSVPIVFCPGSLHRLDKAYLQKLLAETP